MSCTVCESQQAKYKCPKCLAKYCSVACCKVHKDKNCTSAEKAEKPVNHLHVKQFEVIPCVINHINAVEVEESEDFVHEDKLAKLGESEEVKALLNNPHLRAIMVDLVNSEDPTEDMSLAMHEPIFLELANACLKVVEEDEHGAAGS